MEETIILARILWDYHHMNHVMKAADCILVLGSHDTRVAERGAELFLEGWAPLLILSGGLGRLTNGTWTETEADKFARIAIAKGVPESGIIVENRSTNTGENIVFTQELLTQKGLNPQTYIVVQKPYMERRSFATFKKHLPEKDVIITSPKIPFDEYANDEIPIEKVISIMVGDLQRIRVYPERGFQVYQQIPANVWQAYEQLVSLGFNDQLVKD